jgi:hypothetical protein
MEYCEHGFDPGLNISDPTNHRQDVGLHERCTFSRRKNRSRAGTIQGGMCVHHVRVLDMCRENSFSAAKQN